MALIFLALLLGLLLEAAPPAGAAEVDPANAAPSLLDFEGCVRLAIQKSPYLTKSAVEIDIRRLDEGDSRYSIIPPPMTFRTYYYVDRPQQPGLNPKPYSLSFSMDPWNPVGSYFTLQAQKAATRMAIFAHLHVVSAGLERLGRMFLSLNAMKRLISLQNNLISLCRENLTYAENRRTIGTGTSLEVRMATQEVGLAKNELEHLESTRKRTLTNLKIFLGLKPEQQVEFDVRDARRQVLGSFDPTAATLEQAKAKSFELKVLEMKQQLQGYNITVAKTKVLPGILFNTQTPDPLSATTARGLYVGLGLEIPIWDGFKRIRNISRQKAILKQFDADKDMKELDLTDKWNDLQENIRGNAAGLKISQSQEELTRLKERQAEIRYNSGTDQLPAWLEARKASLQAEKGSLSKALECDDSILNLRQFSGDLGATYVDQKSWQK
ncbi:MAG: TolC family protein [Deltaproteobacteria bacterium]|nr:TolC family protein [Deltaproteobacteria bacterium]